MGDASHNHPCGGPTIIPILQMGKLSSKRLDNLPEVTQMVNRGTWPDTHSF